MTIQEKKIFIITPELYAGRRKRLLNRVVDLVCTYLFFFTFVVVLSILSQIIGIFDLDASLSFIEGLGNLGEYLLEMLISIVYYFIIEAAFSQSIGKFITGTIVVDEFGEKPSPSAVLKRSLCRCIPFDAFSFLGVPSRGWHDTISATYVVKKELLSEKKALFFSMDEIGKKEEGI